MMEIEARGLTKMFGKLAAVRDLNLQVPRGTIFGFLGPNGSGKSTTVRMLTGLLAPTAGEVRVAGEPVTVENIELKRKIGVLPEENASRSGSGYGSGRSKMPFTKLKIVVFAPMPSASVS